jgi:hypothetical protein
MAAARGDPARPRVPAASAISAALHNSDLVVPLQDVVRWCKHRWHAAGLAGRRLQGRYLDELIVLLMLLAAAPRLQTSPRL